MLLVNFTQDFSSYFMRKLGLREVKHLFQVPQLLSDKGRRGSHRPSYLLSWLWGIRPVRVPSTPTKMFLFFEVS